MIRIGTSCLVTVWLVLCGGLAGLLLTVATAEETSGPDCKEVYDLIRSHLVGITETQLNEAVVRGLVAELSPRVVLITNGKAPRTMAGPRVSKAEVFQGDILYIRCLLYTSDAADDLLCVDLGGRRIIKKKKKIKRYTHR